MLPDYYVQSTEERLHLYQKLADLNNKIDLLKVEHELIDRFGPLPEEAKNLLKSVELKWLAERVGFEKIVIRNGVFLGYFPSSTQDRFYSSEKFQGIIEYLTSNPLEGVLKEKQSREGSQLLLRKEKVESVEEVTRVLERLVS